MRKFPLSFFKNTLIRYDADGEINLPMINIRFPRSPWWSTSNPETCFWFINPDSTVLTAFLFSLLFPSGKVNSTSSVKRPESISTFCVLNAFDIVLLRLSEVCAWHDGVRKIETQTNIKKRFRCLILLNFIFAKVLTL